MQATRPSKDQHALLSALAYLRVTKTFIEVRLHECTDSAGWAPPLIILAREWLAIKKKLKNEEAREVINDCLAELQELYNDLLFDDFTLDRLLHDLSEFDRLIVEAFARLEEG